MLLAAALNNNGRAWKENPEDGAFYGATQFIYLLYLLALLVQKCKY